MEAKTSILLIDCPDRKGLVASIVNFLVREYDVNILNADQHQDAELGLFFMRVEFETESAGCTPASFQAAFAPIAREFSMNWRLEFAEAPRRVSIFVSQYLHCLADLLDRHETGEFRCALASIVSNHESARRLAEFHGIPFHFLPVTRETRAAVEAQQLALLAGQRIDLVVLARYMQILSPAFVDAYPRRIINVHHSFLPAFTGARPYHAAYNRGVKLIGATSHYVTAELDEGPIIEQDVARVSQNDQLPSLIQKGRDLERLVLSRGAVAPGAPHSVVCQQDGDLRLRRRTRTRGRCFTISPFQVNFSPENSSMTTAARKLACAAALGLSLSLNFAAGQSAPARHGIRVADIDPSVKPNDDFFHYADGNGIKRLAIPPDRASVGVFATLADQSSRNVAAIIAAASQANSAPGTAQRRIADLYASYMNEAAIEARGLKPIEPELAAIAAIQSRRELAKALGETLRADVDALNNTNFHTPNLFGLWVAPGFNDPAHYAPYLMEGGLTLPNREFYLGDSARMQSIRTAYQTHIAAVLTLAGFSDADARAARILALEHAIAEKHQSLADNEDIHKANNTWTLADFTAKAPGLDWPEYFRAAGLAGQKSFIVWQPAGFTGEAALVAATPLDAWKDFLAYHLLEQYSGALPKAFADERFNFFGKTLSGVTAQRPREQRAIALVNAQLGDEVGRIYAQRYFSPEAKAKVQALVANLIAAFRIRIDNLTWMAASTKAEAQQKLTTLIVSVGYPDSWRSYDGYDPKPDDLFGNVRLGSEFDYRYELGRLGAPVDRHEWCMEPQTVNAVNMPLHNALNFPAAILQPPFFDPQAPDAANYGAIRTVIGHEISHTFDSEGSAFDAEGRVRNWWTPSDFAHFEASTAKLAAQYDRYKPFADLSLNGRQTIDENTADVAGLNAAYDGFHAALHGQPAPAVEGFSGDQQFFIAFAQNYESKAREAALRQQVMTDPHSPSEYRADTVRNLDAWYPAFNVEPGETLYLAPADRVKIW